MSQKTQSLLQIGAVICTCIGCIVSAVWTARGYAAAVETSAATLVDHEARLRAIESSVADIRGDVKAIRAIVEGRTNR